MANNQLLASDNFASGSLAAGWSAIFGQSTTQIVNVPPMVAEPNALSTSAGQQWTGLTWPKDHASEVTVNALTTEAGNSIIALNVRMQSGANSGYQVNIQNQNSVSNAVIYRLDAGVATAISTTGTVTAAVAGDVLTFQAAGSCLSVYQNGKQIVFAYDTNYISGTPGFGLYSTVNVAHCRVSSWRGYSAVQQDGIWQKQGIVIPAIAADIIGSGELGPQNPSIIFEGNAQLLSGNVFKMWFANGSQIGYAESTDGIAWTRRTPNVITTFGVAPSVIKVGATYHLYDSQVGQTVHHWTSSDGITWTLQSANVFSRANTVYFSVVAIINGTWNALYTDENNAAFPLTTRLATSSDGVTWTDYGSNPVASNFWGVVQVFNVNGTYYAWGQTVNPNAMETTKPGIDPGSGLRMQTTDFITWTNPVHSLSYSQIFEGVNEPDGGAFVSFPVNVGGKAYMYYSAGPDDAIQTTKSILQIALAIGPAPIASIVTAKEDGVQQVATDSFASGLGNWTTPTGQNAVQIVGGVAEGTTIGANNFAVYTGPSSPTGNNQYSEITIAALTGVSFIIPAVLMSTTAATCYSGVVKGPAGSLGSTSVSIQRLIAGVNLTLVSAIPATPTVGDVWRLVSTALTGVGTVLSLYQNGYLVAQVTDTTTSALTSGQPGFLLNPTTSLVNATISLWAGGTAGNTLTPIVVGLTQAAATAALIAAGLVVGTITGSGTVISSFPAAGTLLAPGSIVNLVLGGSGPPPAVVLTSGVTSPGVYPGQTLALAFPNNPNSLDLIQVVSEGGKIVYNLTALGVANTNPTNPTPGTVLGQFFGNTFQAAFLNPTNLNVLQVTRAGGKAIFYVDYLGNAAFQS
jgi:hypothetical protein